MATPLHASASAWPNQHTASHTTHTTTQGLATRAPTTHERDEHVQDSSPAVSASASRLRTALSQQPRSQPTPPAIDTANALNHARQPRAPNPAKKVTGKDDIREAITRQAVADEQKAAGKVQSQHQLTRSSNASSPVLAAAPQISPPTSPTVMSSSKVATRPERGPIMAHRTASIDSTVSSISTASQRTTNPTNAYRVSDNAGPQDAAALITAAGSAEAAIHKLIAEKQQATSHNAQLWRLVEKQRAMILGLNKDLEKALKEKERYRRKLKENLAQSTSAPSLITSVVGDGPDSQEASPSPSHKEPPSDLSRDISVDTRKTSNSSEVPPASGGRSDTPQDATTGLPATPQSANSLNSGTSELDRTATVTAATLSTTNDSKPAMAMAMAQRVPTTNTPPMSPKMVDTQSPKLGHGHSKSMSASSVQASPPASARYYSSPKTRKAPPAPLKLDAPKTDPSIVNNIVDASDSEYEDDPESARSEYIERGRRKTREDDDREREVLARQEDEQRSRSKKEKKSKSRPSGDKIEVPAPVPQPAEQIAQEPAREAPRPPIFQATANPVEIVRSRAVSDASGMLQRNNTTPSLMSPGLPMSPRPGDRPPNSPMPRQMNAAANSIPMSPKAGLPLSPRAPRSAIPLPPQTPLAMISPHLDRAKAYHQQIQPQPQPVSAVVDRLRPSPDATPDRERASTSSDPVARSPGEIYRGLITEQYPDLLLPPNALPSIYVKTASSRMRPSRASFIAPKHADENPVFILAVHSRSDNMQLWRVEKTYAALAALDQQIKSIVTVRDRLPEKALFAGHAPAKIDARRLALNHYFERMLDSVTNDKPAMIFCRFLSDAIGGEGEDYFGANLDGRPDSPASSLRPNRAGYLTKRGKNFGGWKARYFVLDGPNLKYFEGPGGAHLGSIKLQNAQIGKQSSQAQGSSDDEENQFRHAFLILEPKKKDSTSLVRHVLCAESDEERDAWVEALLQYVDYRDDEEQQPARQAQVSKTEISAPRSPRMQKSMSDLRPSSNNSKDSAQSRSIDQVRTINYNETVAGEAPIMGPPASPRVTHTPSPPYDKVTTDAHPSAPHPAISAPTNVHVIQNAVLDWGNKPPPTPGAKDKKRSMFSSLPFGRGRSSSDLATSESSKTSSNPHDHAMTVRKVFGIPLAEAVALAHPAGDATSELPAVVYRCIEYLMAKNAINEEGIFRLSGSNTVIRLLKDRFDHEGDVNLLTDENHYDIHAVASLLKLYLRELPASILTRDLHIDFLKCLEMEDTDRKVLRLNALVFKLPLPNRALLDALSSFMVCIVDNVSYNKMTVRNLGVVFSPTLNLPGPLISLFVEEQSRIFGAPLDNADAPLSPREGKAPATQSNDLRSPRKQMFSDLPTPSYNQTQFQSMGGLHADDTGMVPMHPSYATYQMAPQGDGGYGSLNDALRSPTVYGMTGTGAPTPRDVKSRRRESGMLAVNNIMGPTKKSSASRLREEPPTSF